jgi:predicted nuclease with TOPRIM domain
MATIEERVARLEVKFEESEKKTQILFDKLDKLTDKIEKLTDTLNNLERDHTACIKLREGQSGWVKNRATKVFDAALGGVLLIVIILILKNASSLLPLIGGAK